VLSILPADMGQLVALVTLGSPPHFPSFMPHTPLNTLFSQAAHSSGAGRPCSNQPAGRAGAAPGVALAAAVPRVSILAGAGDFSLPQTHAAVAGSTSAREGDGAAELVIQMRDMPAVWATCSHKARCPAALNQRACLRTCVHAHVHACLSALCCMASLHGLALHRRTQLPLQLFLLVFTAPSSLAQAATSYRIN